MSKFIKAVLASSVLVASMMSANVAQAATASAEASANILAEVTLVNDANTSLNFGTIVVDATGGSVVVSNAGARTSCGGALVCTGTTDAADFTVGGTAAELVNVTVPATVSLSNAGGNTMTASLTSTVTGGQVTLNGSGAANFSVGGSLAVGGGQADGAYTGTFTVTADYP